MDDWFDTIEEELAAGTMDSACPSPPLPFGVPSVLLLFMPGEAGVGRWGRGEVLVCIVCTVWRGGRGYIIKRVCIGRSVYSVYSVSIVHYLGSA